MDKSTLENVQLEDILLFLEREGIDSLATAEDQLCYVWHLFQHSEESLRTASRDLEELRVKHMEEMKQVGNYVNHAHQLTEEREALTHDFEKEIEQLQLEFKELQLQREIELKEIEGMLDQEGLSEIAQSSASEQIAYLLGERTMLLEKLELADPKLNSYNSVGCGLEEVRLKDEFEQIQTLENELQKQQESLQWSKETLNKPPNEELEKVKTIQGNLKRNMEEEAATRLHQVHEKICRLTKKLDTKEKEHNKLELALESTQLEIDALKENLSKLKENDSTDLQETKQHGDRVDRETLALRNYIQEDSERKMHVELDKKKEIVAKDNCEAGRNEKSDETFHERCKKMIEDQKCKHTDLLHKFQKLEEDHEHLLERNEEFDLLLGETQNQTKKERKQFECHVEKLHRKISSLETELSKIQEGKRETVMKSQETITKAEDFQEVVIMNQEQFEVLESKLSEEKAWRKQLASDLKKAQKVLQAESQELERSKSELLYLFNKVQNLEGSREDRHFFFTAYEVLQKENAFLETKVLKLSRQCEHLNQLAMGVKAADANAVINPGVSKDHTLEEPSVCLRGERQQPCPELAEGSRQMDMLKEPVKRGSYPKEMEREEHPQQEQDVNAERQQFNSKSEEPRLREEFNQLSIQILHSPSSGDSSDDSSKQSSLEKSLRYQQQDEELQKLRQNWQRVQTLYTSIEKELQLERTKNFDLKQQNNSLQEENIKIKSELKQAQKKLFDSTNMCSSITADWEGSQQKVRELEQEILKQSENIQSQNNLHEKLAQEKTRVAYAEKKVLELQEKLEAANESCAKTCILDKKQLEEAVKEARKNEATLKMQYQEEQQKRNYNEKHRHHKAKLRKAKEYLRNEVKQRDGRIKQLENELEKKQKLIEKEKASQDQIIMQNDNLLLEKKQFLEKLTEQEETIQGNIYMISSVQNRVLFLGEENKLLQENSDRLTQQISQLERILRNIQVRRGEELTISELSESELLNKKLIFPNSSFSTTGLAKSTENLKVTEIHKSEELLGSPKSSPSSSLSQPFEVAILNVASLGGKPSSHDQDKNQKDGSTDN
ncbi:coiled-coil domain-containing protein 30 isoform X4 [Notamacropus eugenii]|uniref:coiled-coil domain-containing protein 30 isoform X4 n=1 Tax=Notamacropus eugenii TaxID=9315 RepID=UPI003B67A024